MLQYGKIVTFRVAPEKTDELFEILQKCRDLSVKAPGHVLYVLAKDSHEPGAVNIVDVWDSWDNYVRFQSTPAFAELADAASVLFTAVPERSELSAIEIAGARA